MVVHLHIHVSVPQNIPPPLSVTVLNSTAIEVSWDITASDVGPLLNYIIRAYVSADLTLPPVGVTFDALTSSGQISHLPYLCHLTLNTMLPCIIR
jgi:hypothetical protein